MTLVAQNVSVRYGAGAAARLALRDVTLVFARGTVTLLKGPSGSGKTTLLSVLGGLLKPDGGSVQIGDENVYDGCPAWRAAARRRLHFGFVFQNPQLFPSLSLVENVSVPLDLRGDGRRAARSAASDMLKVVGLSGRLDARVRQLSGGEQQRVAIARALVSDPVAVLADEPTAALDAANGQVVASLLRSAACDRGKTVVIVSHDDRLAPHADRVVHLVDGRIAADEA